MNKIVHYLGLDVHKDSIAVSIAPQNSSEVRRYGISTVGHPPTAIAAEKQNAKAAHQKCVNTIDPF